MKEEKRRSNICVIEDSIEESKTNETKISKLHCKKTYPKKKKELNLHVQSIYQFSSVLPWWLRD